MVNKELDELIHDELLPIRQMFLSYSQLCNDSPFKIDPKILKKCAVKTECLIAIARELANDK